jgi:hypothetical protein
MNRVRRPDKSGQVRHRQLGKVVKLTLPKCTDETIFGRNKKNVHAGRLIMMILAVEYFRNDF